MWLEQKFHNIWIWDIKGLKAVFKFIDKRLMRIEENLNKFEWTVDKLQAETINIKQTIGAMEDLGEKLEGSVKYLQDNVEEFGKEYDELE